MPTVDDILGRYKPAEKTVRINLDGHLAARIDELRESHRAAVEQEKGQEGLDSRAGEIAQELMELRATQRDSMTEFTFTAIGGEALDELIREHPPTETQWARFREVSKSSPWAQAPDFDAETIAPHLVSQSLSQIDGEATDWTPEDAERFWKTIHEGARADLLEAAWAVNQRRNARPTYGTGTDETPNTGPGSTTPLNGESHSLSSTDAS